MVTLSRNEGGKASKTAARSAKDAEQQSYKLTAMEAKAVEAYAAARTMSAPRLKAKIDGKDAVRFEPDHPDEAIGILALMQAIGTTILLSMRA